MYNNFKKHLLTELQGIRDAREFDSKSIKKSVKN